MAVNKKGLGRGLDALLGEYTVSQSEGISEIDIRDIDINTDQPRKNFNEDKLRELSESIKQHGIVQPIIVCHSSGNRYMVVAGERRYRAARMMGLKTVPCIIRTLNQQQIKELSLIENIQREGLNAIEIASALNALIEEHDMTHEELAEHMGKSRSGITNAIRLLQLPQQIQDDIRSGKLSSGQARPLIGLEPEDAIQLAGQAMQYGWSAREVERRAIELKENKTAAQAVAKKHPRLAPELKRFESKIRECIGAKTVIKGDENKGTITLSYNSRDELDSILQGFNIDD